MDKTHPANAGYDQPSSSYDQTIACYNQSGQNEPPQPGYYQIEPAPYEQPGPVEIEPASYEQPGPVAYAETNFEYYAQSMGTSESTALYQDVLVPSSCMYLAIITIFFGNPVLGAIAVFLSYLSQDAAKKGDIAQAFRMGTASMWISIIALVMSAVCMIVMGILAFSTDVWYNRDCYEHCKLWRGSH